MKFLDKLEKRLGFLAVPNVIAALIVAQLFIYGAMLAGRVEFDGLLLIPKAVLAGEWWRLASFMIAPPYLPMSLPQGLFLAFFWYILWMMSNTLEEEWGSFRFNVYVLTCVVLAVVGAFVGQVISPAGTIFVAPKFLYFCVFFAFATLNPNIEFLVMFIIPMKVKWMAWILLAFGFLAFLAMPTIGHRLAFAAPFLGYALFFRASFKQSMESRQRRAQFETDRRQATEEALHTCEQCGASDQSDPERDFRYKSMEDDMVCLCNVCRESAN
jgi:hypothetical protein